ncbi:MAG: helix-turn-helix domain-containing protein [Candidatus Methanomethylicaceae archaeon]
MGEDNIEEDILLFLLIKRKEGEESVNFKDICEKLKKPEKTISQHLDILLKRSLINEKKKVDTFSFYSLTDKGEEIAKEIRKERREKIKKEDIMRHFIEIENEKLEKLIFIMDKNYLNFPIIFKLKKLKEYIAHIYVSPLRKIEFMNEKDCIEGIKKFWIKEDYLKEEKISIDKILKKEKEQVELSKFEENILKIFQDFNEYSKNSDLWIKRNMRISAILKILVGILNGILSSYLALFIISGISMLIEYFLSSEVKIVPPLPTLPFWFLIASISLGQTMGAIYAFYYEEIKKKISHYIKYIFSTLLIFFLPYLIIHLAQLYLYPYSEFITTYTLILYLLYILLCNCIIIGSWNIIVRVLFYFEFHIWKTIKEMPEAIFETIKWISEYSSNIIEALRIIVIHVKHKLKYKI